MQQQTTTTPRPKKKIKVPKVVNGVETLEEIEVDDDSGGPQWGPNDKHRLLNKKIRRVDAPLKVSGAARYSYDMRLPGMLIGRLLLAPHARARVVKFDAAPALRIPGVRAVIENRPSAPAGGANSDGGASSAWEVRYHGQPIAAVAATTREIAEDALRAIVVEYEKLPHAVTPETAMKPDAPQVLARDPNVEPNAKGGDLAKVEEAMKAADVVVEAEFRSPIVHHSSLETHGIVVDYRGGAEATIYASTQGTFTIPGDAAKELGLPESSVTAVVEHMGGGFGSKFGIGIEGTMACRLAKQLRVPIKMMLTRRDEFVTAGNRSGSWQTLKAGARKDGTIVAFQAVQRKLGGIGDGSQRNQPYIYQSENSHHEVMAIHTNEDASRAMRAPGHPQASFAIESMIDLLAQRLNMDPLEVRKKNLKDQVWHRQLDRAAREIGWSRRNKTPGAGAGPLKRGIGCSVGTWGGGGNKSCVVDVRVARDGAVTVAVGTQDLGTGTRTYTRAIVAEEFGLGLNDVVEKIGNSKLGSANASGGSTTAASLAPAVKDAAHNARVAMTEKIAPLLGPNVKPEQVTFANNKVSGGGKTINWKQACAALPAAGLSARGEWRAGLSGLGVHGVAFAEVEVDIETGAVRPVKIVQVQDVGLPLNRLALESQINGGIIQSLGMALWEGRVMDAELGLQLNPAFNDYKIPGCLEIPEIVAIIDDDDKREQVIGVGESAVIPALGALVNAVFNATGVQIRDLPITPDKVLNGVLSQDAGGRAT